VILIHSWCQAKKKFNWGAFSSVLAGEAEVCPGPAVPTGYHFFGQGPPVKHEKFVNGGMRSAFPPYIVLEAA